MLETAGFEEVRSMEGGIHAWQGLAASGGPEAGISYFPPDASAAELIALAWLLEEGNRRFYLGLPDLTSDGDAGELFRDLGASEQHHQQALAGLYKKMTHDEFSLQRHLSLVPGAGHDVMEGGVRLREALTWAKGRSAREVLEFAIALETNSYDLYVKMERRAGDQQSRTIFEELEREEKGHLARQASLLNKKI